MVNYFFLKSILKEIVVLFIVVYILNLLLPINITDKTGLLEVTEYTKKLIGVYLVKSMDDVTSA